jgi:serum/glucocorticoid-regulated kinase 2
LIENIIKEKEILLNIDHPFLVCMRYAFSSPERLFFIMDYIKGGQLYDYLQDKQRLEEKDVQLYVANLASAVGHLHDKNLIHGDIKSSNIFIDTNGYLILADFRKAQELKGEIDKA